MFFYDLHPVDHVRGVGAHLIVIPVEAVVAVHAAAGHAVVPAVTAGRVPAVQHQNHQNVDHARRCRRSNPRKTTVAGMRVRSAVLRLRTLKLVVGDISVNCNCATYFYSCRCVILMLVHVSSPFSVRQCDAS